MAAPNSDMRVVIAGAGGRMGRALIQAVAATKGLVLAGAVEAAGSAVIGRDTGELAGLGPNGIKVTSDVAPLLREADGLIEFTIPAATLAFTELTAAAGKVHVIGTTGHSAAGGSGHRQSGEPRDDREIRQYVSRRQSPCRADQARGEDARTTITTSKSSKCITTRRSTRHPAPR